MGVAIYYMINMKILNIYYMFFVWFEIIPSKKEKAECGHMLLTYLHACSTKTIYTQTYRFKHESNLGSLVSVTQNS